MLSISEILSSDFAYSTSSHVFQKHNIVSIDNTQDEIKFLASEIEKEFRNEPIENDEDTKIQKEFWKIYFRFVDKKKIGNIQPRISPNFLRKNLDLLN